MPKSDDEKLKEYLSFFNRKAQVKFEDMSFTFSEDDFKEVNTLDNYWHHKTDPLLLSTNTLCFSK